jgi:hypothetical protein
MCGNVFPEYLEKVFPKIILGWIDARTFSEPLGGKTKRFGLTD